MGSRTTEFVLGLLGGIFGFLGALVAMLFGGLAGSFGEAFGSAEAVATGTQIVGMAFGAIIMAIIGIVGAAMVKNKKRHKLAGGLMIISAIGGLIAVSFAYVLATVLLLIAGIMALRGK